MLLISSLQYCFMKQKCHLQMCMAQFKNLVTLWRIKVINITHKHFQMIYNFVFSQGAQKLSATIEMEDLFY